MNSPRSSVRVRFLVPSIVILLGLVGVSTGSAQELAGQQVNQEQVETKQRAMGKSGNGRTDNSWSAFFKKHPRIAFYVLGSIVALVLAWPLAMLGAALRRVKWLNKEITWPAWFNCGCHGCVSRGGRSGTADTAVAPTTRLFGTLPTSPGGNTARKPDEESEELEKKDPFKRVDDAAGRWLLGMMLILCLALPVACIVGIADPDSYVPTDYRIAFRVVCILGLVVTVVLIAVAYLWLEEKLGVKD